VTLILEW
jgi:hypothetical protein